VRARAAGVIVATLVLLSTAPQSRCGCESGILDDGAEGMNVVVYELCARRLSVGFRNSDVIEEIACLSNGDVSLWILADPSRCPDRPAADGEEVYELREPLKGVGRATALPVRQLLTCRGPLQRATIVVPDARSAILETRTGDTKYEKLARHFVSQCFGATS
jgi:hypothetical protein